MNIGISARGLRYISGGVKEFTKYLCRLLPLQDTKNQCFIYYSSQEEALNIELSNVTEIVINSRNRLLWDHVLLPIHLKKDGIDIALFLKGTASLLTPCKTIVNVNDLIYNYPGLEACEFLDRMYMLRAIPLSIKRADAILTISNNTRMDIHKFVARIPDDKINVIYLASGLPEQSAESVNIRKKHKLGDAPFIFMASSISPRKNIERTLLALARIADKIPHNFVVTGGMNWGKSRNEEILKSSGLESRFIKLGCVDGSDLIELYKNADFYIMPSLYEGFSMTILEAMESGCPVAASNTSSHPEVVGDAGLMFDPYSIDEMSETIYKLATDSQLRDELRAKGFEQAKKFSWDKCARETLEVINSVIESGDKSK